MLDILLFKFDLWKLQRQKYGIGRSYKKKIDKARKENKSHDEIESLIHEDMTHSDYMDDYIAQLLHRILNRQAEKYLIPTPKYIKGTSNRNYS